MKFSIALRLLNTKNQDDNLEFIKSLLVNFASESQRIYGNSFLCYNVHVATHLTEDYKKFGVLHNISAFSFESYLGSHIKGAVRSGFKPLIQVAQHVNKQNSLFAASSIIEKKVKSVKCDHSLIGICLKKFNNDKMVVKPSNVSVNDCYIVLKSGQIGEIIAIHEINERIIFQINIFPLLQNFFLDPMPSSQIGIYKIDMLQQRKKFVVNSSDLQAKLFVVPFKKNTNVAIPLLH